MDLRTEVVAVQVHILLGRFRQESAVHVGQAVLDCHICRMVQKKIVLLTFTPRSRTPTFRIANDALPKKITAARWRQVLVQKMAYDLSWTSNDISLMLSIIKHGRRGGT